MTTYDDGVLHLDCDVLGAHDLPMWLRDEVRVIDAPDLLRIEGSARDGGALEGCPKLTELRAPRMTVLEYAALRDCKGLLRLHVPSLVEMGPAACWGCDSLTSVDAPHLQELPDMCLADAWHLCLLYVPNVSYVGPWALTRCESLRQLSLPEARVLDTGALSGCTGLTSLRVPHLRRACERSLEGVCASALIGVPAGAHVSHGAYGIEDDDLIDEKGDIVDTIALSMG